MMKLPHLITALLTLTGSLLKAEVTVTQPWVRATVPAQKATGAFMQLQSKGAAKLVSATCDVTKTVEIHEMKMEGDVMKMREVPALDLPDGETVSLKPGGYHIMLLNLEAPLKEGQTVTFTLTFEKAGGEKETVEVKAPVRPLTAAAPAKDAEKKDDKAEAGPGH